MFPLVCLMTSGPACFNVDGELTPLAGIQEGCEVIASSDRSKLQVRAFSSNHRILLEVIRESHCGLI
ncbi:hypothetical protein AGR7C_pTi0222 [Agrobacterium deltaense Zutra 3/1]|uniref:Uncharacterized protein n=1 Tax=Agrobacterium deltaense Zutra 3/1 TaxID=1183427 RepID=A0A1S7S7Y1_9HYPH|nr:hypothetical protein AGR7C_pTi0222 [Agrobacterium deltaense Zutra 3/1]